MELYNRIDLALRFAQGRLVTEFKKEESLEIIIQRISDLKAQAAIMSKGAGKGQGDQQMG